VFKTHLDVQVLPSVQLIIRGASFPEMAASARAPAETSVKTCFGLEMPRTDGFMWALCFCRTPYLLNYLLTYLLSTYLLT